MKIYRQKDHDQIVEISDETILSIIMKLSELSYVQLVDDEIPYKFLSKQLKEIKFWINLYIKKFKKL